MGGHQRNIMTLRIGQGVAVSKSVYYHIWKKEYRASKWRSPLTRGSRKRKKTDRVVQQSKRGRHQIQTTWTFQLLPKEASWNLILAPVKKKILCDSLHFITPFRFSFFFLCTYLTHVHGKSLHKQMLLSPTTTDSGSCPNTISDQKNPRTLSGTPLISMSALPVVIHHPCWMSAGAAGQENWRITSFEPSLSRPQPMTHGRWYINSLKCLVPCGITFRHVLYWLP